MVATAVEHAEVEKLFLAWLPEIQSRASLYHRYLSPADQDEAVAEVVAWSWGWMLSAARRGKLNVLTPRCLVLYASKMYSSGRRFAGSSNSDVMGDQTRAEGRTKIMNLEDMEQVGEKDSIRARTVVAALTKSRFPSPVDMARMDLDYALAMGDLTPRSREVFDQLLSDHERGCLTRIASDMKISVVSVWQHKTRVGEALTRIGYNPAA